MRTTVPSSISSGRTRPSCAISRRAISKSFSSGATPEIVIFKDEILHPKASFIQVRDHRWRPILEILYAAHLDAGLMHIDPIIGCHVPLVDNQADNQKVSIAKAAGSRPNV